MTRQEEAKLVIDKYLKDNNHFYTVDLTHNSMVYQIDEGTVPLFFQLEFLTEEEELEYSNYCIGSYWMPLSEWGDSNFSNDVDNINSLEDLIDVLIKPGLEFYGERLKIINKINKKLREIKEVLEEYEIDYNEDITFETFLN